MSWQRWNGDQIVNNTEEATMKALEEAAYATGDISLQQVPHDTGVLSKSLTILKYGDGVVIGYGGGGQSGLPEVPYAERHHEVPANFQKGRKHNYLRDPVRKDGPRLVDKAMTKHLGEAWR